MNWRILQSTISSRCTFWDLCIIDDSDDEGILSAFTATVDPTEGIVEAVDEEKNLVESKFEKMDEQDDIHTTYVKLYKVSEMHKKLYRLSTKKLSEVELERDELSTKSNSVLSSGGQGQIPPSLGPLGDLLKALMFLSNLNGFNSSPSPPKQRFNSRKEETTPYYGFHTDYPGYDRLRTVSKDELISHFCGTPSIWGGKLNTPCSGFAKGLRFLNMVITFILTPLSHYNFITEPCACFLLSLMEDLTIDFPSHFITSIIDVYRDTGTRDKLIFPSAIT
ncbi:hypothetical protein SO802_007509 [Lithocarpus litseifolius]|uniref:Rab-GAP TBC domain-containing protein n=1 Tax=Lithocarpus litseifolius TaxID=425828 RepID=A0AAW2DPP1_9ROSI